MKLIFKFNEIKQNKKKDQIILPPKINKLKIKKIFVENIKEKVLRFIEHAESLDLMYEDTIYYPLDKEKIHKFLKDKVYKSFKESVNSLFIQNFKMNQARSIQYISLYKQILCKLKDTLSNNIVNNTNLKIFNKYFLSLSLNNLKRYYENFNLIKKFTMYLSVLLNMNILFNLTQSNINAVGSTESKIFDNKTYLNSYFEQLNFIENLKETNFFLKIKDEKNPIIKYLNLRNLGHLFNLFYIKLIVKKNNIFGTCYSVSRKKGTKTFLKKRIFMSSAGRVGFKGSNKKTRPAIEKFSKNFFLKLKNYIYKSQESHLTFYNLVFEYENMFSKQLLQPFFDTIDKKQFKIKQSILKYKLPHNLGIRGKKKRRI